MAEGQRIIDRRRVRVERYSRLVRFAKIALPVLAVVLVGLIFLTGRERGGIEDLFTPEELARLGAGLRLNEPRFAGVTEGGEPYILRADAALPDGAMPDEIGLEEPRGEMTLEDGRKLTGESRGGVMRRNARRLTLAGEVVLKTSDGYRFETEELTIDFENKGVEAPMRVRGTGPNGEIEADRLRISSDGEDLGTAVLRFEHNVHVLFNPPGKN